MIFYVIQFIKSNEKLKFRQLIDIVGVDYPQEEKRFKLIYLFFHMKITIELKFLLTLK